MISIIVFEAVFLPTLIYALLCGGQSERAVILILAAAFTATPLLMVSGFTRLDTSMLLVSIVSFSLLMLVTLRSEKYWPLSVTAMQGLVVISHIAPLLNKLVGPWTYYMSTTLWSYLQLFLVAIAVRNHRRYWVPPRVASVLRRSWRLWSQIKQPGGPSV